MKRRNKAQRTLDKMRTKKEQILFLNAIERGLMNTKDFMKNIKLKRKKKKQNKRKKKKPKINRK